MINELHIREYLETREESLSPYAARSAKSKGRARPEEPSPVRTAFQRDRDRIIHTKAFRRLKDKTQVFIAPVGDHFVTRLTHTLEVMQIARTISRALNLNEDLTEAISLGHDLGHTPFGHVGEEVLNQLFPGGFRHSEQSLRVIDLLERDGAGLNLTAEVRDGILNHSKPREGIMAEGKGKASTLEGEVCRISDSIAYINHDIADAVRADIITPDELPIDAKEMLGNSHSERINTMVLDIITSSWSATGIKSKEDSVSSVEKEVQDTSCRGFGGVPQLPKSPPSLSLDPVSSTGQAPYPTREPGGLGGSKRDESPVITMSPEILEVTDKLRDFLFERVYNLQSVQKEADRAREVVRHLYEYLTSHEDRIPHEYPDFGESAERRVVDYISGMTDQFAIRFARKLGLIKGYYPLQNIPHLR